VLLDEPLSNLDASLREEMRLEISQVTRQLGITAVYVTHDQREALALSDVGTPEEIYRLPTDDFVARFVGYANAIPIWPVDGGARIEADGSVLATPDVSLTGAATAFIHASAVELELVSSSGPNRLHCTVADAAFMGDHVEYVLRQEAGTLLKARAPIGAPTFARGTGVAAFLPPDKLIVVPRTLVRTVP
jgi:ABC-type Fe3+/spermidine/putrescine transport system ATPase subunit